ncbi:MAG: tetratricopeptide repeat protein [Methanothrix sp.]
MSLKLGQKIAITISEVGGAAARAFSYRILIDEDTVAERQLTPVQSQQVREMAAQYASLFRKGCAVRAAQDYLSILGDGLFQLFFEKGMKDNGDRLSTGGDLTVASTIPDALQLPWEYLKLAGEAIGFSERFSITRRPIAGAAQPAMQIQSTKPEPGPLRVLFFACEPLDYDLEEQGFLRAMEGRDAVLQIGDLGTFDELKMFAKTFRPHLIHLVGQAKMSGGKALFVMQDEDGRSDAKTGADVAEALKGSGVQCLILGGCQSEHPESLDLLAMSAAEHLPLAVAWNSSAASAASFYGTLEQGVSVGEALGAARRDVRDSCLKEGKLCALPILYSSADHSFTDQQRIFDAEKRPQGTTDWGIVRNALEPLPGMTEGYAFNFVNRRRDLHRLLPAMQSGAARTVIITGKSGMGKSALATRLARQLALFGYSIIPVYSSRNNPLSAARFLEAVIGFLTRIGKPKEAQSLRDAKTPPAARLKSVQKLLNEGKYLILWDGLDLEEKTGRINDAELAAFYMQMLKGMESSRAIITCSSLPADALTLPKRAWEWPLSGLAESAFIKFLLQDEAVAARYRRGETSHAELIKLHSLAAGSPGLLSPATQAAKIGAGIQSSDDIPKAGLSTLGPDLRLSLGRAAVFGIAVNSSGLAAAAGISESAADELIMQWQQLMLAYPVGKLWALQPSLRPGLLAALSPEERSAAEEAAAAFLRDLAEEGQASVLGLSRLDALLEARGHYLAAGDTPAARSVTSRISSYLVRRGYYAEVIRQNLPLLPLQTHPEPMNWIAQAFMELGNFSKAAEWYARALESGPDRIALQGLGMLLLRQGKNEQAKESFCQAEEICRTEGDTAGVAAALQGLASIDLLQKEYDAAMEKMQKTLDLLEKLGDLRSQSSTLQSMAMLDFNRGNLDAARTLLMRAVALQSSIDDRASLAEAQYALASIDFEKGDYDPAAEEFRQALQLKREIGEQRGEAAILHNLGLIESQKDNKESAFSNFRDALQIYQDLCDKPGEAGAFFQLGALAVQMDKMQEGLRLMALAAVVLRSIKSDDVKNVEPMVERLASKLNFSQEQFMVMVQEVLQSYLKDRGWGLVEKVLAKK